MTMVGPAGETHTDSSARPRAYVLTAGDPANDPRIGWVARTLAARFEVCELGLHRDLSSARPPQISKIEQHRTRAHLPATPLPAYIADTNQTTFGENEGWNALAGFAYETSSSDKAHSPRATRERHAHLRRILRTNVSLIRAARALGPAELIVAADIETLAAGAALKQEFGARLIYDAHEFWPYSFPQFSSAEEEQAWIRIERKLLKATDARFVVSPGLAEAMEKEYGTSFLSLPNAVPLAEAASAPNRGNRSSGRLEFLFLGGFAPERGLKLLIGAWSKTPANCVLLLQGPDNPYKLEMIAAAKQTGLLGSRILFPPPVPETNLIERAAQADVGLVPYEPTLINHIHCSPNKLSQYMAAGLPILANNTRFVEQIVQQADCGLIVDFNNSAALASAVSELARDESERRKFGLNARRGFEAFFNWDVHSPALDAAAGFPKRSKQQSASDPVAALKAEFQKHARDRPASSGTLGRLGRSALRLSLKAAWHGIPFLRVIVLSNPRYRQRAEEFREL